MSGRDGGGLSTYQRADSHLERPRPSKRQRTDGSDQRLPSHETYSVGWVCALDLEFGAAEAMFDEEHDILPARLGDNNTYTLGRIGRHNVVLACLPGYGTSEAAAVACNMLRSFPNIRIGLMVGIGGGVPSGDGAGGADIRLGDVVVGDFVVQHDKGKTIRDGLFERTGGSGRPPPNNIATAVKSLRGHHMLKPSRIPDILAEMLQRHPFMANSYARPVVVPDRLFEATYDHVEGPDSDSAATCHKCSPSRVLTRPPRSDEDPRIHYGKVASGNVVIKHGVTRDRVAGDLGAICFEMEAAGLVAAAFPCLTVRGISDYADSHKNGLWQEYAAATASAYAKELLSIIPADTAQETAPLETGMAFPDLRQEFLDSLKFDEMSSRQMNVNLKKAHPKTCDWLLSDLDYVHWLDPTQYPQHRGFLWISGKPGAGKSTLMNFAYKSELARKRAGASVATTTICFFFNARGAELERTTAGMYRSLLVQLLEKLPDLKEVLDQHPDLYGQAQSGNGSFGHYTWDAETLHDLFASVVEKLRDRRLTCFIDALDECDDDQVQAMVDGFEDLGGRAVQAGIKLYICFSSRHYPRIVALCGRRLTLENQPGHERDLERYVRNKLKAVASQQVCEVQDEILRKSGGVFLWVVLVVDILNKEFKNGRVFHVKERLQEIPDKLSELFRDMLRRDSDNMDDLFLCIQWILFAKRPLRREEFYYALVSGLSPCQENLVYRGSASPTTDDMDHFVLSSSKGLAEISMTSKKSIVQFIHESVRDFFLKDNGFHELWPENGANLESQSHETLKSCCLSYLAIVNTYTDDGMVDKLTELAPSHPESAPKQLPFLEYATCHVLDHAESAAAKIPQDEFLRNFELESWIKQWNYCEKFKIRRYTQTAGLLYILAERNLARLIRTVRRDSPCINILGGRHRYPLFAAVSNSHRDAVKALLLPPTPMTSPANSALDDLDYGRAFEAMKDETPLMWAAKRGFAEVVKLLLEMPDAQLEHKDREGHTALMYAAIHGRDAILQVLLEKGANAENAGPLDPRSLSLAAREGHRNIVQLLIRSGADVNYPCFGQAPLSFAIQKGHADIVQLLIQNGADVDSETQTRETPLSLATQNGDSDMVQLLIQHGANVNCSQAQTRDTPLLLATQKGDENIVQLLIQNGADVDSRNIEGYSPLSFTAENGQVDVAHLLIQNGADVHSRSVRGQTPFSLAAENGHVDVAHLLIRNGADVHSRSIRGQTPLSLAAENGHMNMVQLLLDNGADSRTVDNFGWTPLQHVALEGYGNIAQLLIQEGADVDCRNNHGRTPLSFASGQGHWAVVKLLLDKGANTDTRDRFKLTPLLWAVQNGHMNIVQLLLEKGADSSATNDFGQAPLSLAAERGYGAIVLLLMQNGADIDSTDVYEQTPLLLACRNGQEAVAQLLIERGTNVALCDEWAIRQSP